MTHAGDKRPITVGDLRRAIEGVPDNMPVVVEISEPADSDLAQAWLRSADVEERCDEVDCLYLYGDCESDEAEGETAPQRPEKEEVPS